MTRRGCALSLMSGMMLLVVAGIIAGGVAGAAGVALISKEAGQETDYNTMYSQSSLSAGLEEAQGETDQEETDVNLPLCGVIPAAVTVAVVSVAVIGGFAYRNLRREPLVLLEQYEE